MSDFKKRIEASINKFSEAQLPKKAKRKKSNSNPEGEFVLKLKEHIERKGWSIDIIEAKAVYNAEAGRYISGKVAPGYSDISGNMSNGHAVYIETKAPGKRSTVRPEQREFLIRKISTNAFAIVCDSIEYFDSILEAWLTSQNKKALLLRELPELSKAWQKRIDNDGDIFD